jgi:hypothetical protein
VMNGAQAPSLPPTKDASLWGPVSPDVVFVASCFLLAGLQASVFKSSMR